MIYALIALNCLIGYWNAKVVGLLWNETEFMGPFPKLVLWAAATQSVIAFSTLTVPVTLFCALGLSGATPEEAAELSKFVMSFWYLLVIIPALGTGLVLVLHSWVQFFRTGSLLDGGVAAWNTFAQAHNMYEASQSIGPAWETASEGLGSLFKGDGDDAKGKLILLGVLVVIAAMLSSLLITIWIIKHNMGRLPVPDEVLKAARAR